MANNRFFAERPPVQRALAPEFDNADLASPRSLPVLRGAFEAHFFDVSTIQLPQNPIQFALPPSFDLLPDYLNESETAVIFKGNCVGLLDRLKVWGVRLGLDGNYVNDQVGECIATYFDEYQGQDMEINQSFFPMYTDCMIVLNDILTLLDANLVPAQHAKGVIKTLIDGITVCVPGVFSNLEAAYSELKKPICSLPEKLKIMRYEIAKQCASLILHEEKASIGGYDVMQTHYVNATIFPYSAALAIDLPADQYRDQLYELQSNLVLRLIERFGVEITKQLTPATFVDCCVSELSIDDLPTFILKRTNDEAALALAFDRSLAIYGGEREDKKLYLMTDLVDMADDDLSCTLSWKAYYILYASITQRLIDSDMFKINYESYKHRSHQYGDVTFFMPTDGTFKMAYVKCPRDPERKLYQPMLTYVVGEVLGVRKESLLSFLNEKLSPKQRVILVQDLNEMIQRRGSQLSETDRKQLLEAMLLLDSNYLKSADFMATMDFIIYDAPDLTLLRMYFEFIKNNNAEIFQDYGKQAASIYVRAVAVEKANIMFELGVSPNVTDGMGQAFLHKAIIAGKLEWVQRMISHHANVNQLVDSAALDVVLAREASRTAVDAYRLNPSQENFDVMKMAHDQLEKYYVGYTPLKLAILKMKSDDDMSIISLLIGSGADLLEESQGMNAFNFALLHGKFAVAKLLFEKLNVNLNVVTDNGLLSLNLAVRLGDLDMVAWLIERGANPLLKDVKHHQSALEVSVVKGDSVAVWALLRPVVLRMQEAQLANLPRPNMPVMPSPPAGSAASAEPLLTPSPVNKRPRRGSPF